VFYFIIRGIAKFLLIVLFKIEIKGLENIPKEGKYLVCSNHASNWDPMLVSISFPRQIFWMAKKELFNNKILSVFFNGLGAFPVDRENSDISAIKNALRVLKQGHLLGMFPEGTRTSGYSKEHVKPGVAMLAVKSKSSVIPVRIESNYKFLSKVKITIGSPVDFSVKDGQVNDYETISDDILRRIYSL